jgi:hypothetical protein
LLYVTRIPRISYGQTLASYARGDTLTYTSCTYVRGLATCSSTSFNVTHSSLNWTTAKSEDKSPLFKPIPESWRHHVRPNNNDRPGNTLSDASISKQQTTRHLSSREREGTSNTSHRHLSQIYSCPIHAHELHHQQTAHHQSSASPLHPSHLLPPPQQSNFQIFFIPTFHPFLIESSRFTPVRWPSGLRRQLKVVYQSWYHQQYAGPKGRGFKSHSHQYFFCSLPRCHEALVLVEIDGNRIFAWNRAKQAWCQHVAWQIRAQLQGSWRSA